MIRDLCQILKPPKKIATKDWVNQFRQISAKSSARPGKFRTSTTPYIEEILDCLDDPKYDLVVCMKSAQIGWTDGVINNYVARRIDIDPCPMIIMFPKEGAAKEYEKEKFRPMVQVTEQFAKKLICEWAERGGTARFIKSSRVDS